MVQRAFYPEASGAEARGKINGEADEAGAVTAVVAAPAALAAPRAAEPCHLYLLHPPGGVAGGDEIELEAQVGAEAHALLTTPAAGKFYRRGTAGGATVRQDFTVDGVLEWLPQENLFHPDASVRLSTVVRLSPGARFVGWEISCLGMPARALTLQSGSLRQGMQLWCGARPLLIENLALDQDCVAPAWGLAGSAVLGTCLAYPATAPDLERARAALDSWAETSTASCAPTRVACTLVDQVLVCRAIGARADRVRLAFTALWRALRPGLLGRDAVPPRIWAT
jgi:urease accessory protein